MSPSTKILAALLSILSLASAFPGLPLDGSLDQRQNVVPFNAAQQYVSNKGANAFIAPGPGDSRSPCPALNVMANHGYIPRNGLVTLVQIQQALPQVFGLSTDLVSFLSLIFLSGTMKGDAYDIGGFPPSLVGETAYQFIQTYKIGTINAADPMKQICTNYEAINGQQYRNSDFFSMGGAVNDELFFRTFSNKSAEYPLGYLDGPTKLSMLAMSPNGDGTFTWHKFMNAIPDNWYKSNALAPFSVPLFAADMIEQLLYGCSPDESGSSSSSTNYALLTNGAYTNADLADPNNFMCFLAQAAPLVLPALANQAMFDAYTRTGVASSVTSIQKAAQNLDCSAHVMKSINMPLLSSLLGLQL